MKKVVLFVMMLASFGVNAQTLTYKVYALKFAGTAYPFTVADWAKGGPKDEKQEIDFMFWLIRGNGKTILLDAGFLNDLPDAAEFKVINYIRPDSALLKFGVNPYDVTDIILSHPHWDHIDGLSLFPKAHVWIQREDYNNFVGAAWKDGKANGFEKRDVRHIIDLNLAGKVTLVDGDDHEILPGIKVFTGSKHTYNSQYVLVNTGPNKIVLASDNIWVYYSLKHLAPPGNGGTLDTVGYVKAMERMKTMVSDVKFIIPGHDAEVFAKFPVVAKGVVEIR